MFADAFLHFFHRAYLVLPILLLAYIAALGVSYLKFHPYAKYPGPLLAKLTNLYGLYHAYVGDLHLDVWRYHERYGTIIRLQQLGVIGTTLTLKEITYATLQIGSVSIRIMASKVRSG